MCVCLNGWTAAVGNLCHVQAQSMVHAVLLLIGPSAIVSLPDIAVCLAAGC